jgi:hypothetical protein
MIERLIDRPRPWFWLASTHRRRTKSVYDLLLLVHYLDNSRASETSIKKFISVNMLDSFPSCHAGFESQTPLCMTGKKKIANRKLQPIF